MALTRINNQALTNVTSSGLPSGSVIQVKTAEISGAGTTANATSFTDTGITITITPKFSDSKFFVSVSTTSAVDKGSTDARIDYRCVGVHNGTTTEVYRYDYFGMDGTTISRLQLNTSGSGMFDATTNTNDIVFKTQMQRADGQASQANQYFPTWYTGTKHQITVMEIAG